MPKPSGGRRRAVRRENTSQGLVPLSLPYTPAAHSTTMPASTRYFTFWPQRTACSGRRSCFLRRTSFFCTRPDSA